MAKESYDPRYYRQRERMSDLAFGEYESITMNNLYDNKQDCKDDSHLMYDNWEWLREEQNKQ